MWRPATRAVTGTNDTPLPNRRRFGAAADEAPASQGGGYGSGGYGAGGGGGGYGGDRGGGQEFFNGRGPSSGNRGGDYGRGREMERDLPMPKREEPAADQPRKRRSRWGDADVKTTLPGLPTMVSGKVSQSELDNYAIHVRLEEIARKLRDGDIVPPERMRSPSPPPSYNAQGVRTNTREVRYRKKLEDERIQLVDKAMKSDPNFRPPAEYHAAKRMGRPQEKVYIPKDEFPEINFFGLLVGPRGNSLKKMESESGAKISIRGKGSVKEGKGRPEQFAGDEEDELHCLVMADTQEKVDKCVALINKVIETAASIPEGQNDHKRNQLRELAALNGTLRDDENQLCQNCGEKGHRKFECPQARQFNANVICRQCGGAGHMARDCFAARNGGGQGGPPVAKEFDSEYQSLMAELGEGGAPSGGGGGPVGAITNGAGPGGVGGDRPPWGQNGGQAMGGQVGQDGKKIPPWRIPENWFSNRPPQGPPMGGGYQQGGYQQGGYGGQQGYGGAGGYGAQQQQPADYSAYYQQYAAAATGATGSDPYAAYYAQMAQNQQAQPAA